MNPRNKKFLHQLFRGSRNGLAVTSISTTNGFGNSNNRIVQKRLACWKAQVFITYRKVIKQSTNRDSVVKKLPCVQYVPRYAGYWCTLLTRIDLDSGQWPEGKKGLVCRGLKARVRNTYFLDYIGTAMLLGFCFLLSDIIWYL